MWPRSGEGVLRYRRWLRQWVARLIVERVRRLFPALAQLHGGAGPRILEFGAGGGHQIRILKTLGPVVGSDIYMSSEMSFADVGRRYVVCDIARAPFQSGVFDLIYSNHVLEHIAELDRPLDDVQRIGAPDCTFAFSVPTPLWLFLGLPAKYLDRMTRAFCKLANRLRQARHTTPSAASESTGSLQTAVAAAPPYPVRPSGAYAWLFLGGHGEYRDFLQAVRAFRAARWRQRFAQHGFTLVEERSVLLYATARWRFIPANRLLPRLGLASSRVFIMQRATTEPRLAPSEQARSVATTGDA